MQLQRFKIFQFKGKLFLRGTISAHRTFISLLNISTRRHRFMSKQDRAQSRSSRGRPCNNRYRQLQVPLCRRSARKGGRHRRQARRSNRHSRPILMNITTFRNRHLMDLCLNIRLPRQTSTLSRCLRRKRSPSMLRNKNTRLFLHVVMGARRLPYLLPRRVKRLRNRTRRRRNRASHHRPYVRQRGSSRRRRSHHRCIRRVKGHINSRSLSFLSILLRHLLSNSNENIIRVARQRLTSVLKRPSARSMRGTRYDRIQKRRNNMRRRRSTSGPTRNSPTPAGRTNFIRQDQTYAIHRRLFRRLMRHPVKCRRARNTTYQRRAHRGGRPFLLPHSLRRTKRAFFLLFFYFRVLGFVQFSLSIINGFLWVFQPSCGDPIDHSPLFYRPRVTTQDAIYRYTNPYRPSARCVIYSVVVRTRVKGGTLSTGAKARFNSQTPNGIRASVRHVIHVQRRTVRRPVILYKGVQDKDSTARVIKQARRFTCFQGFFEESAQRHRLFRYFLHGGKGFYQAPSSNQRFLPRASLVNCASGIFRP